MNSVFSKINKAIIFNGIICLLLLLFFLDYFFDFAEELQDVTLVISILVICLFILRYKNLLLYGLAFVIPISVPFNIGNSQISLPSEAIAVLLSFFFFTKIISGRKLTTAFLKHPITLLILLDLLWLFLSSVFSQMPDVSFKRFVIRLSYYIAFYYFYYELFKLDLTNIKKVFTLHITGFLVPIGYAVKRHAGLGFTTVGSQRISEPFYFDHTIYGACLVFFIPFILFSCAKAVDRKEKYFYAVMLLIFVFAAVLSYSRAAWISLLLSFGLGVMLKYKVKLRYLVLATAAILSITLVSREKIMNSLNENKEISHSNNIGMHFKSISNINTDASNKERINRWKCALRMFADKPLMGFGPGTYQFFYGQYQREQDMTRISTYNGTKGHAHSEYLNYLSETGIFGLLIFLSLVVTVSVKAVAVYKNTGNNMRRRTALFLLLGLITYFIHAFFNGFLEFDKMAMPVFISFAALAALDTSLTAHVVKTKVKEQ